VAWYVQGDSELLSGFPFIGHGNPDNNLESRCMSSFMVIGVGIQVILRA
jgi:hypothetical protein